MNETKKALAFPAFESLDEKRESMANDHAFTKGIAHTLRNEPAWHYSIIDFKSGFNAGVIERDKQWAQAIESLKVKVLKHKDAYALDIFPNSEKLDENSTRDSISARMGRHMCDCFLEYIANILSGGKDGK